MKSRKSSTSLVFLILILNSLSLVFASLRNSSLKDENQKQKVEISSLNKELNSIQELYRNVSGYNNFLESQNKMLMEREESE